MSRWPERARRAAGVLALVWIGVLVGVDLVAAPAPFRAEGLARVDALVVNRELFGAASSTEQILFALTVASVAFARPGRLLLVIVVALAVVVALQALWLLPALAARTDVMLAGGEPGRAPVHGIYVGLEGVKLVLLAGLVFASASSREKKASDGGTG